MNDDEITLKENEDRRRIMREQSEHISKLGKQIAGLEGEAKDMREDLSYQHEAADFLRREGYERCDVPACNCGSWHSGRLIDDLVQTRKRAETAETTCEKQSTRIAEHKKLLFQQRKIHEWSTTLHEIDLAEIQAAWCDFDAVVEELKKHTKYVGGPVGFDCPTCKGTGKILEGKSNEKETTD